MKPLICYHLSSKPLGCHLLITIIFNIMQLETVRLYMKIDPYPLIVLVEKLLVSRTCHGKKRLSNFTKLIFLSLFMESSSRPPNTRNLPKMLRPLAILT